MDVAILADEKIGMSRAAVLSGAHLTRRAFVRLAGAAAVGAALGSAVLPLSGCAPAGDVLRVGTKIDVPGFGFQNPETGSVEGWRWTWPASWPHGSKAMPTPWRSWA